MVVCDKNKQELFFNHVENDTKRFLEEIYLCTITARPVPETEIMMKEINVALRFDTINGRKKLNLKDDSTMNAEINLSKKMCEKEIVLDLDINMTISSSDNGKTVDINMIDNDVLKKSALRNFSTFFSVNLGTALKFYLKKRFATATARIQK